MLTSRWIYKIKHVEYGSIKKDKAWFSVHGFSQKEEVDYDETFTLVAKYTPIRAIISPAFVMRWRLHQMDVKTMFLNCVIEEEV